MLAGRRAEDSVSSCARGAMPPAEDCTNQDYAVLLFVIGDLSDLAAQYTTQFGQLQHEGGG